mmetsp:Transcript_103021/g.245373  ORF Transcript_103021/g.245373 Transcript_103021/m.245373 type:complete len:254 (+) Transcript_103021:1652-2413(+)
MGALSQNSSSRPYGSVAPQWCLELGPVRFPVPQPGASISLRTRGSPSALAYGHQALRATLPAHFSTPRHAAVVPPDALKVSPAHSPTRPSPRGSVHGLSPDSRSCPPCLAAPLLASAAQTPSIGLFGSASLAPPPDFDGLQSSPARLLLADSSSSPALPPAASHKSWRRLPSLPSLGASAHGPPRLNALARQTGQRLPQPPSLAAPTQTRSSRYAPRWPCSSGSAAPSASSEQSRAGAGRWCTRRLGSDGPGV